MFFRHRTVSFVLLALLCSGLGLGSFAYFSRPATAPPEVSFYHWKTEFTPAASSLGMVQELASKRLFIRFFDVSGEDSPFDSFGPKATAIFTEKPTLPVVPVIYIHNADFGKNRDEVTSLGKHIVIRTQKMLTLNNLTPAGELQIDCDWNYSTQKRYFALLNAIKAHMPPEWVLSVTVRMHELKNNRFSPIPPADRGTLMLYNMGNLTHYYEENSILNPAIVQRYLNDVQSYPLPLDIALPLFSWGVVFDENQRNRGLLRTVPENLETDNRWERSGENRYKVLGPCTVGGRNLQPGWEFRVERVSLESLEACVPIVRKAIGPAQTVIFYHLDTTPLSGWTPHALRTLATRFQ